ncbi:alpha/beta fold hydrolase [Glutamicibacter sp.]|uniref:alpha/beta fold hydrolase n=1 Tax=Glutamicibacter sp. TaxID=1931995 RepID=UPI0028BD5B44|nr:alpha/beta fold hydrolase [Glutamicibacter sp.]
MTTHAFARHALVFGASGLIGRHLVLSLVQSGAIVTAAVRSAGSRERLQAWLQAHGVKRSVDTAIVDFEAPEILDEGRSSFSQITEIHNCAASFKFGMNTEEARRANVGIVEKIIDFAKDLPHLQRIVHISGYRVGGQDPSLIPWSEDYRARVYRELGPYEASKVESDAIFQARAQERGIPWTIINPSSVIGDSKTGESDQLIGLGSTVKQVWDGSATALPGNGSTFLPVVTVDYLAAFMSAAAIDPEAVERSYWVLDDETPSLAELLTDAGHQLGVKAPRLRIPVSVIKRLPSWITKADPETLVFLSEDRYPTQSALALADRNGITMPEVKMGLGHWVNHMAAHRFGDAGDEPRRFRSFDGVKTFELGTAGADKLIFPGLPVNADTWAPVAEGINGRAVDLPGLGLSGGEGIRDWGRWLPAVLSGEPIDLIGHSLGAAAAVLAADRYPEQIKSLTLIAPFFLQESNGRLARNTTIVGAYLRHVSSARLSQVLTGTAEYADQLDSSVHDLRRRTAKNTAKQLATAGSRKWRNELSAALDRFRGPIRIITGSGDPLNPEAIDQCKVHANRELISIEGAGHHPQLTHSEILIELLRGEHEVARINNDKMTKSL